MTGQIPVPISPEKKLFQSNLLCRLDLIGQRLTPGNFCETQNPNFEQSRIDWNFRNPETQHIDGSLG